VAARFPNRERASAALDTLRRRLRVRADDAAIAPLGIPGLGDDGDDTLLAGRFRENSVGLVRRTLTNAGGDVVADVDERLTRSGTKPPSGRRQTKRSSARERASTPAHVA
jgi:hypothetical protein